MQKTFVVLSRTWIEKITFRWTSQNIFLWKWAYLRCCLYDIKSKNWVLLISSWRIEHRNCIVIDMGREQQDGAAPLTEIAPLQRPARSNPREYFSKKRLNLRWGPVWEADTLPHEKCIESGSPAGSGRTQHLQAATSPLPKIYQQVYYSKTVVRPHNSVFIRGVNIPHTRPIAEFKPTEEIIGDRSR